MRSIKVFFLLLILCGLTLCKPTLLKDCTITKIHDGDTITCNTLVGSVQVRIKNIDAPELSQLGGLDSRNNLVALIPINSKVTILSYGRDKYGRILGDVRIGDLDIATYQVKNGHAWVYRAYCKDKRWYSLEDTAKQNKDGLWGSLNPEPPWDYRKKH